MKTQKLMRFNKYINYKSAFLFFLILCCAVFLLHKNTNAETSLDLSGPGGGSIIPGFDAAACDTSTERAIRYNSTTNCVEFCNSDAWTCVNSSGGGSCSNIGDVCSDGSVYAGLSPDGNVPMYTTPADSAGGGTVHWSNSTGDLMADCTDGPPGTNATCQTGYANTQILAGNADLAGDAPYTPFYQAAFVCLTLLDHGQTDWYLPSQDELRVLYTNRVAIGGFGSGDYWSSSENNNSNARAIDFGVGGIAVNTSKSDANNVRCVRK